MAKLGCNRLGAGSPQTLRMGCILWLSYAHSDAAFATVTDKWERIQE